MLSHDELIATIPDVLRSTDLQGFGPRIEGKVRDIYLYGDRRILITTDRVSAFDRVLGAIPYKGQVLNQLSLWWFERTSDIVPNHVIESPDVNVTVAREAKAIPVEVIVRGYITGVTSTAMWTLYEAGDRAPYGIPLPDGLKKNDPLSNAVITPTTKAGDGGHDQRLTRDEIIEIGLVREVIWRQIESIALALYARGHQLADSAGLVLVDTKYEFGLIGDEIVLIDEIHTPDSSRYWLKHSCQPGSEPEHVDKEYLRKWYAKQGYRGEGQPPEMPPDFIADIAARYISVYERLTGAEFVPGSVPADARIATNLVNFK